MKLHLKIDGGTLGGNTFELETGFLTIGRSETCSIRFDPLTERIASKQHAFIEARPDGFYITDNKSTNGTLVNGVAVDSVKLNSGDQIQFGANGVIGNVQIDAQSSPAARQDFAAYEQKQFDKLASSEPVSVSMSLKNIGLGHIESRPPRSNTGFYIGIGVAVFLAIPLTLVVVAIMYLSLGLVPAVLASLIAFVPAAFYILPLAGIDRYDPEPFWLLALAFGWGALVAVIVSIIINTLFEGGVYAATGSGGFANILGAVISAPVIEEASKGTGLLILLLFFRRYFDDILDGIVYGGVIALGFATVENVLYYGRGLNQAFNDYFVTGNSSKALLGFLLLFTLRGILSPFAHVTFTSMTGVGCGLSRESHNGLVRIALPILGYIFAVVLHGIWNAMGIVLTIVLYGMGMMPVCSSIGLGGANFGLCGFFTGYLVLELPLFLGFVVFALFLMRRQRRILNEMLAMDIARGLFPEEDLARATSVFKSTSWRYGGLFNGKFLARTRYLRAIGKLGLSYWHIQRATAAQGQTGSFQQNPILRDEVLKWRDQV
jgi:RsiW-degrading membrane proteinase PrsW (M82 family)